MDTYETRFGININKSIAAAKKVGGLYENKIFNSILLNKLEGFYGDLNWILSLNPYKQKLFNL